MRKISGAHGQHKMGMRIPGGFDVFYERRLACDGNAIR
jgi:hypothetical protein